MTNAEVMRRVQDYLLQRLIINCPVRTYPLGATKYSPRPGNLRQNGINITKRGDEHSVVTVGGSAAIYGPWTEKRSKKPGWQKKSRMEAAEMLVRTYGGYIK